MGVETIVAIVVGIAMAAVAVLKALYGTSEPQKKTVEHAKQDVEITDGKTDEERLKDLGI